MVTRYSRRLPTYRRRSTRAYRFPSRASSTRYRGRRYTGRGSYYGLAATMAARALPYAARAYGAYRKRGVAGVKRYAGRLLASTARSAIKRYTGYGSYSKVGKGGMTGQQAPRISNGAPEDGSIVISNKEFLGDVMSSTSPVLLSRSAYNINPGDPNTFPWLSSIARNFQEYRLEGLAFTYRSMYAEVFVASSTTGGNGAQGTVIMSTQYDPTVDPPATKEELENTEFAQSGKPSETMTHFVECARGATPLTNLYIASEPESQKGDERFYNFGTFILANQGIPASNAVLGELWVSYQIRLFKPKLSLEDAAKDKYFGWNLRCQPVQDGSVIVASNDAPFGNVDMTDAGEIASLAYKGSNYFPTHWTPAKVSFPGSRYPKMYIVRVWYFGQDNAAIAYKLPTLTNAEFDNQVLATGGAEDADVVTTTNIHAPKNGLENDHYYQEFVVKQVKDEHLNGQPWTMTADATIVLPQFINVFRMSVTEIPMYDNALTA